ncbi:MAG: fused MFS/spermidine synthase, partial [Acidobacteria bacterium]|nr:fused MFS/spermidine synthase [Acidobacteriota bacterium]
LVFALGAASLGYEVLWTRILLLHLGSSVYAYSIMLLLVLLGIASGSLAVARVVDRSESPLRALAAIELALGASVLLQIFLFQELDLLLLTAAELLPPATFGRYAIGQMLAVLPLLGPPTFLMGMAFPFAVRAFNRSGARIGEDAGSVYGANTLGAVVGSLATGFLLIPLLGTQSSLLLLGGVNALLGAAFARRGGGRRLTLVAAAAAVAIPACILLFPPDRVLLSAGIFQGDAPGDLEYFHEDAQATVTIRKREKDGETYRALAVNGVDVAGSSPELEAVQRMQGHLPMLLGGGARSVVHIGFGSGGTAWAVAQSPVERILIVEISPEVIRASDTYFGAINRGVLSDPRVAVEINDGRNFLLASPERFDAVLSDSIHPAYAGNGSLYSLEYFRLIRERVRPGGVVSMWLPLYYLTPDNYAGILRAFGEVFPKVAVWYEPSTINAFTIVTGKLEDPVWDPARVSAAFSVPAVESDLAGLGIRTPVELVPLLLATEHELASWVEEVGANTDDRPRVEYESARLLDRNRSWLENFSRLLELRPADPPAEYLAGLDPDERREARRLWAARTVELAEQERALAIRIQSLEGGEANP